MALFTVISTFGHSISPFAITTQQTLLHLYFSQSVATIRKRRKRVVMAFYYYLLALPLICISYLSMRWLKRKIDNLQQEQEQQEQDDEQDEYAAAVELITPAQNQRVTSAPARRGKTNIVDRGESRFEARIDKAKLALLEHIHYDDNDPDSSMHVTFSRPFDGVYRVQSSSETESKTSVASEYSIHLAFQPVDDHRWSVRGHAKTMEKDSKIIFVVNDGFVARKSGQAYWVGTTTDHTNCTRHVTQGCFDSHASFKGTFEYESGATGIYTSFSLVKTDDGSEAILAPSSSCPNDGRGLPVAEAVAVLVEDEAFSHAAARPFAAAAEVQREEETGCNGKAHCIV